MAHSGLEVTMALQGMWPADVDSWITREEEHRDQVDQDVLT